MSLFRRRQMSPLLEDAIAQLAEAQRVEPITFADRWAAVCDAVDGAEDVEVAGMIRALLSLITDPVLRAETVRELDREIWKELKP